MMKPTPDFALIETIRYEPSNGFYFVDEHCQRLQHAAQDLHFIFSAITWQEKLTHYLTTLPPGEAWRIRCLLHKDGHLTFTHAPLTTAFQTKEQAKRQPSNKLITMHPNRIDTSDCLFKYKTTAAHIRDFYDQIFQQASHDNLTDVIFCNLQGCITEGTRTNIVIEKSGEFFTPPTSDGCLPGVYRGWCLANNEMQVKSITQDDLVSAENIYCINSVRGWVKVNLK